MEENGLRFWRDVVIDWPLLSGMGSSEIEAFPSTLASRPIFAVAFVPTQVEHAMRRILARAMSHIRASH